MRLAKFWLGTSATSTATCTVSSRVVNVWGCLGFITLPLTKPTGGACFFSLVRKADVSRAFDNVEHPLLDRALVNKGAPKCLRAALLRELTEISLEVRQQAASADDVDLGKGGKQGCTATPREWNILLDDCLGPTTESWRDSGYGFCFEDGGENLTHGVWADDCFFFATSMDHGSTCHRVPGRWLPPWRLRSLLETQ